ncbi:glycosyltransferase family 117 protein [Crocinitomix algicola]|uniref:glycosyltransferase family 117 protein n=1 Tax=Crocinitomix algicola TaxID=1740263 RepID=UPI000831D790|nr:DUF2723 domain-containing protein [Crocinitomix algicola]
MDYKRINTIVGWMVFIFATTVYLMTIEPTTSLWDCGEYITTAYKLEVGHPPGAPLFMMLGRLFTMFSGPDSAAMMVNAMSALSSSFTILFLFWTITMLGKKIVLNPGISLFNPNAESDLSEENKEKRKLSPGYQWAIIGSGVIGAIAYTFTDSFWFSAVEGEVYAMSSFFTAIVVWAIFKWDHELGELENDPENTTLLSKNADRWIVLIFFMIGLSIGVHLLNLLCIPVIAYVIYFRKYKETTIKGFILTGLIGVVSLGFIQAVMIPKTVQIAGWFERFFVNSLGLGFYTGTIFFFILLTGLIVFFLMWSKQKGNSLVNTITWSATMILLGYSCFAMIVIRSNANTPLDENDPENLVSLESYLKREQYGDWPILRGPYFNSDYTRDAAGNIDRSQWADASDVYLRRFVVFDHKDKEIKGFETEAEAKEYAAEKNLSKIEEKYFKTYDGSNQKPTYKSSHTTLFPRMYSPDERHVSGYKSWSAYDNKDRVNDLMRSKTYTRASEKERAELMAIANLPTMGENLTYFANYQVDWMYWRYFMWNFSGRQNDEQGHGSPRDGNWISGLNFIDQYHLGDQSNAPSVITDNPSHNKFYMLPLILGLIGFIFMLTKATKGWWLVMLLFLLTGFAIIIYLNQKPSEPRERDYAYAASFYAFAIYIGMSVLALYDAFKTMVWRELGMILMGIFGLGLILLFGDRTAGMSLFYMGGVIGVGFALMMILKQALSNERSGAIIAFALTIPVPIIMGMQSWDDHDRSGRYTAQALAQNYLNSCVDNSVIFTNGDNDTFPLWYLQEVEGTKTSVRVCCLSLLNTDWYTEQMTRKAYDSEPLPISFSEEEYRQHGARDYMYVLSTNQLTMGNKEIEPRWKKVIDKKIESNPDLFQPAFTKATRDLYGILAQTKFASEKPDVLAYIPSMDTASNYYTFRSLIFNILNQEAVNLYQIDESTAMAIQNVMVAFNDAFDFLPAKYAMEYMGDDDNLEDRQDQKVIFFPTTGLRLDVNKENAIASGILAEEDADRAVDFIRWKLAKTTLMKADLMILDIVAHSDWKRPVYFASSASRQTYLGLDKYFFAEGLVYKLVPIEVEPNQNPNSLGEVNLDQMYENLMSTYNWGNIEKEGVLVDYYTRRLTNNYRVQFAVLADAYGDAYDKAKRKIEIMKQIQSQNDGVEISNEPIKTPVGDIIPSQIPAEIKIAEAEMADAKAKISEVLDRGIEIMPHSNVPFGKVFPSYIQAYYIGENEEKAKLYTDQMLDLFGEEMNYYLSVDPEFSARMIEDMYSTYRGIFSLYQASAVFGTDETHQQLVSDRFFSITSELQNGLTAIRKYCIDEDKTATLQLIQGTFDAFFQRINS